MSSSIALIVARGGSKRVPRKNVRLLAGLPLVAWPVRVARASGLFDRVIISTEDAEIAAVAVEHGAEQPFERPACLADDYATSAAVREHALDWLAAHGEKPDVLCMLYGTSCFVTEDILRQGLRMLQEPDTDRVFAATAFPHPIERGFRLDATGLARRIAPEYATTRTQDLPSAYYDIGLFYWHALPRPQGRPPAVRALVVPRTMALDIDTEEDFALAEVLARMRGLTR